MCKQYQLYRRASEGQKIMEKCNYFVFRADMNGGDGTFFLLAQIHPEGMLCLGFGQKGMI